MALAQKASVLGKTPSTGVWMRMKELNKTICPIKLLNKTPLGVCFVLLKKCRGVQRDGADTQLFSHAFPRGNLLSFHS